MKRYLVAGLLAVATPTLAHADASLPVIGWGVSSGHSATGGKICTLFGGFGNHSGLAWEATAASPPQHFTLFFDDGGAPPQPQIFVSQLVVAAPRSPPLFISGTVRFGQFRTTLDRRTLEPLLHLFAVKSSMTVALEGGSFVLVNLKGSADAAQDLRRCEAVETTPRLSTAPVRVAAKRHSTGRARRAALEPRLAIEEPLPAPPPVAPALPAIAPAALKPPVAAAPPLPAHPPAAPALPAIAPAALKPPVAAAAPLPAHPPAAPALPAIAPAALKPPVAAATPSPAPTPTAAAQMALDDTMLLAKAIEDQFTAILLDGKASYENINDKDLSLGARATRATDLCILLGDNKEAIDWTGTIADLHGSSLTVKLADGITVGTTESPSADSKDPAMIDPASDVFRTISQMHVGERVTFSGRFFASDTDCIKETSPTENGSMTSPHFAMAFTAVAAQP